MVQLDQALYQVLSLWARVDLGAMAIKGVLHIPQSSSITGASPPDCLVIIQDTHWERLTLLQRCSWCILQPPPTGPPGHTLGGIYPTAEMQLVYSVAIADLGHQDTHWEGLTLLQRCSWCILQPQICAGNKVGGGKRWTSQTGMRKNHVHTKWWLTEFSPLCTVNLCIRVQATTPTSELLIINFYIIVIYLKERAIFISKDFHTTGCLNIHRTYVTITNFTYNNVVFFLCFRFENSIL